MDETDFDWIVVGGGIAGISIAEILSRNGNSVLVLEKNPKLASETTKEFHEWWHTGVLFSLVPDNFSTSRYLLGALDDLFEYYSGFEGMNIKKLENGISIKNNEWFNNDAIIYKFRNLPMNPLWMYSVAKSILLSKAISNHDWLRRHAGGDEIIGRLTKGDFIKKMLSTLAQSRKFLTVKSPDFTINSRKLLSDLISAAVRNGSKITCENGFEKIEEFNSYVRVYTKNQNYRAKNIVFCSPDLIARLFGAKIKYGYAPMGVYEGVSENQSSFVQLDFNTRNCINLLKKKDGLALAGGITMDKIEDVKDYFNYVHNQHVKQNPNMRLLETYIGVKKELIDTKNARNYQYHIKQNSERQWSVVLGKFSLFTSLSAEFYRRAYKKNSVIAPTFEKSVSNCNLIAPTYWAEISHKKDL